MTMEETINELGQRVAVGLGHENYRFIWPEFGMVRTADGMPVPEIDVFVWRYELGYRQ